MLEILKKEYIDEVVEIHIKAFPESQSTKFGKDFLKSYYGGAVNAPNVTSFVWKIDGKVTGFIFGGANKQKLSLQIMMNSKKRLGLVVLKNIIHNPINTIVKFSTYLMHYIIPGRDVFYADDTATLDSIAILKEYRSLGIADKLIIAFLTKLNEIGVVACRLGVKAENTPARRFYEKNGFEQVNAEGTIYIYFFSDKFRDNYKKMSTNLTNE
jgi:ribosomal protein S18 acetylase RimI-like enzyme